MLTFLVKRDILYTPLYHYEGKPCYYDKVEHLEALPRPYRPGYLRIFRKGALSDVGISLCAWIGHRHWFCRLGSPPKSAERRTRPDPGLRRAYF